MLLWRLDTRSQNSVDSKKQQLFIDHFRSHSDQNFLAEDIYAFMDDFSKDEFLQARKAIGQYVENLGVDGESQEVLSPLGNGIISTAR